MIEILHAILRWIHIVVGILGLFVFWIPVFAKKGGRLHITTGKIFAACGWVLIATAYVSCIWALASPTTFFRMSDDSPSRVAEILSTLRFLFTLLLVLATWVMQDLAMGLRVLRVRKEPTALSQGIVPLVVWYALFVNLGVILYAIFQLTSGEDSRFVVHLVLGLIGCGECRKHFKFIANPSPTRMAWWYKHMECMLGTGVAFHTAFLVFGFSRLFGFSLRGWIAFIPWVLPVLIGAPSITVWVRHYKQKFGELD